MRNVELVEGGGLGSASETQGAQDTPREANNGHEESQVQGCGQT